MLQLTETKCLEEGVYQFTLTADAATFEAAINAAFEAQKAGYTLAGYEKGQAPRAAIEAQEGEDCFYFDAVNALLAKEADALLQDAFVQHDLTPLTAPAYDITQCDKTGLCIVITIGVLPAVTLGAYKDLTLHYPRIALPEDAVTQQLEQLRHQVAKSRGKDAPLPALDDDFAQLISEHSTLAALRAEITASFERYVSEQSRQQASFMLLERIGQTSTMALPKFLWEAEYQKGMRHLHENLAAHGVSLEQYCKDCGQTQAELEQTYATSAMAALRGKLAIYTIAKREQITVTPLEVESEQVRLSAVFHQTISDFMAETPAYLVKNDLTMQRTLAYLTTVSTLVEMSEEESKNAAASN